VAEQDSQKIFATTGLGFHNTKAHIKSITRPQGSLAASRGVLPSLPAKAFGLKRLESSPDQKAE
jgi:hypothetical protein